MSGESDRQRQIDLMVGYQKGDYEAFESLYHLLRPMLLQFLTNRTRDRSLAEDLLQEAFLQMHRSRRTYQPGRPVLPWAVAIARNVFLMHRRSQVRRGRHETQSEEELPEIAVPTEFEGAVNRQTLKKAILQLAPNQREVLLMQYTLGLSLREIAGILGIGRSAAKLRSFRGIRQLRRIFRTGGG